MKKPRMAQEQIRKLGRLLFMRYKPSELSEEIGCNTDTIYKSYLHAGCPNSRDAEGNIWIVGTEFAAWARTTFAKVVRARVGMGKNQAWCMKCRKPVDVTDLAVRQVKHHLEYISGKCAMCGTQVHRARAV